jgi:hypothetical protein
MWKKYYSPGKLPSRGNKITIKSSCLNDFDIGLENLQINTIDEIRMLCITLQTIVSEFERIRKIPNMDKVLTTPLTERQIHKAKQLLNFLSLSPLELKTRKGEKNDRS